MTLGPDPLRGQPTGYGGRGFALNGNLLAMSSMMMWAAGFPAAEMLLQTWPPLTLIAARFATAVPVMILLWLWLDGHRQMLGANWARALWVGGIGFGGGTYLILLAQALTDPVTVALIASCAPLVGAVLEFLTKTRRLSWRLALGVAASIAGGIVATNSLEPGQIGLGAFCAVGATILFTWASMVTARDFPTLSSIGRGTITLTGGLIAIAAASLIGLGLGHDLMPRAPIDQGQIGMLLIYACLALGLSQVLFVASIGKLGVTVASFHINTAPFYVMIIMMVLGAGWNWMQALGAGIVALGVVLAQSGGRA
ncbi:DMT family transporter [Ruegeria sp. 2205SS24-7]|uniref:DMT family transporter n=1 Tax=Ruegeria discodermiae TaxID=3064389 RepID=UPI00274084E5|nr:DMT family transporter [Ruegeria sp. 2205SS24-7]MDP5217593.1 DMT family transporter [Ruegeria sp. 2205SS24-7]